MTTGKTIALITQLFVSKVMPLIFNMLSKFVTAFFPKSKCLLISWLQSPSAVIEELKDSVLCIPWGGTKAVQQGFTFVSWLLLPSSLTSSCCSLPFETQGRSWRLQSIPYKQEMGDMERFLHPGAPQVSVSVRKVNSWEDSYTLLSCVKFSMVSMSPFRVLRVWDWRWEWGGHVWNVRFSLGRTEKLCLRPTWLSIPSNTGTPRLLYFHLPSLL